MFLSRFRKPVDKHLPFIGDSYRYLREITTSRTPRRSKYGFRIAGAPGMADPEFEKNEAATFLEALVNHDIVLDIGANIGFYSCLASSRGKHVLAFEPSRRNFFFLCQNLWDNGFHDAEVIPVGLGSQPGLRRIYGFGGISSFIEDWGQAGISRYAIVPVNTLDNMIGSRFKDARILIKMDVEGYELDVLKGATGLLCANPRPTWMVEIMLNNPLIPGGVNGKFLETFETFWKHGYACKELNASPSPVSQEDVLRWTSSGSVDSGTMDFMFH